MCIVNQEIGPGVQRSWGSNNYVTPPAPANITQRHNRCLLPGGGLIVCVKRAVKAQVSLTDMRTVGHSGVFCLVTVNIFLSVNRCDADVSAQIFSPTGG